eukprot:1195476-Prorocentrum_minimum.AAC.3
MDGIRNVELPFELPDGGNVATRSNCVKSFGFQVVGETPKDFLGIPGHFVTSVPTQASRNLYRVSF